MESNKRKNNKPRNLSTTFIRRHLDKNKRENVNVLTLCQSQDLNLIVKPVLRPAKSSIIPRRMGRNCSLWTCKAFKDIPHCDCSGRWTYQILASRTLINTCASRRCLLFVSNIIIVTTATSIFNVQRAFFLLLSQNGQKWQLNRCEF